MKDIKFRAWDKKTKKMRKVESIGFGTLSLRKEEYPVINLKGRDCINNKDIIIHRDKNQYYLMQYTGLKDKNGVEIYEGDIVETCDNKKQLVVWHNNGFKFKFTYSRTYQGEPYTETTHLELRETSSKRWGDEVIGNIYENSELLK